MTVYEILGVNPNDSDEVIKKRYHQLMKEAHPDLGGSPEMAARYNEAYAKIKTPELRKKYDEENLFTAEFDMLTTVFGRPTVAANFGKKPEYSGHKPINGKDIKLAVNIPVSVFICGSRSLAVSYKKRCECMECGGTGGDRECKCPSCGGSGYVYMDGKRHMCEKCGGAGTYKVKKCSVCNGKGYSTKTVNKPLYYAPGMLETKVTGAGHNGLYGGENGDLCINFKIKPEDATSYDPESRTIRSLISVKPEDLVLGTTKKVVVGDFSQYIQFSQTDFGRIPVSKKIGNQTWLFDVLLEVSDDDILAATERRNSRINELI